MCPVSCCNSTCIDTTSDTSNCGACGNACGAGQACGAQPPDWTANGSATYDTIDNVAQLTDTGTGEAGTWVFNRPITVDDVAFQFDFYSGGGTTADGLAFMLESDGANAVGGFGGVLGVSGLTGFAVEMDEYDNAECSDDNGNHIGIDALTTCGDGPPTMLVYNDSPGITISDGAWHTVVVHVSGATFTVSADGADQFGGYAVTAFTIGPWYVGFGGGTGGLANYHRVRNVRATFTAGPRCY
jgi:Bacterial lectin